MMDAVRVYVHRNAHKIYAALFLSAVLVLLAAVPRAEENLLVRHTARPPVAIAFGRPQAGRAGHDRGNATAGRSCQHTSQGRLLTVDDRGAVCDKRSLDPGGCCSPHAASVAYSCKSCRGDKCCDIYEYCVACCLDPALEAQLTRLVRESRFQPLFSRVHTHFGLCQAQCRTSSLSVFHQNKWRDERGKHCYGLEPARQVPSGLK